MTTPQNTFPLSKILKKLSNPLVSLGLHFGITLIGLGLVLSWMYFDTKNVNINSAVQMEDLRKQLSEVNGKLEEYHKASRPEVVNLQPLNNQVNQLQSQIEALIKAQKNTEEQVKKISGINLAPPILDTIHTKLVQSSFVLKAIMDRVNHGQSYKDEVLILKSLLEGEKSVAEPLGILEELSSFETKTLEMLISELESIKSSVVSGVKQSQPVNDNSTVSDSWFQWLFRSIKGLIKITRVEGAPHATNHEQEHKILDAALVALQSKRLDRCLEILKPLAGARTPLLDVWMTNASKTQRLRKNIDLLKQNINSLLAINSETKTTTSGEKQ